MSAYDDILVIQQRYAAVAEHYRAMALDNPTCYLSVLFTDSRSGLALYQTELLPLDEFKTNPLVVKTAKKVQLKVWLVLSFSGVSSIDHFARVRLNVKRTDLTIVGKTWLHQYFGDGVLPIPEPIIRITGPVRGQSDTNKKLNPGAPVFRLGHHRAAVSYYRRRNSRSIWPNHTASSISNLKKTILPRSTIRFSDVYLSSTEEFETERKTVIGADTPNFKSKKKWELKDNPYLLEFRRRLPLVSSQDVTYTSPGGHHWLYLYPWDTFARVPAPSLSVSTETQNVAIARLQDQVEQGQALLLANMAQAQKTIDLVAGTAARLVRGAAAVKRGAFSHASQILFNGTATFHPRHRPSGNKSLAQNWLAFQYGWKPLLGDIETSLIKLQSRSNEVREVLRARGSASKRTEAIIPLNGPFGGWNSVTEYRAGEIRQVRLERCLLRVNYEMDDFDRAFANQTGFTNPLSLAWELLPFSFVVDWFLPVERFLTGLTAFQGVKFHSGSSSQSVRVTSIVDAQDSRVVGTGPNEIKVDINWMGLQEDYRFRREVLLNFPSQSLPSFKNPLSVGHMLNGLAVLRSVFK